MTRPVIGLRSVAYLCPASLLQAIRDFCGLTNAGDGAGR